MTVRLNTHWLGVFVLLPYLALAVIPVPGNLLTQTDHTSSPAPRTGVVKVEKFERKIPDFLVQDQNGKQVRFYSDLIRNRVVVLGFFFTRCSYVCDLQGRSFAALQKQLGKRLGKQVFLISVTRTPAADRPANLKAWARKFRVQKGWTLVTGDPGDIAKLVATFAQDNLGPQEMHSAPLLIGNDATGSWLRSSGTLPPEKLIESINKVAMPEVPDK